MVNIYLVDDHPLIRDGLANLLNDEPGFRICGQAGNSREATQEIESLKPDLVVLDLSLGDESGLILLKTIKSIAPETHVLIFSMHEESQYAERALKAGAAGYLMKQEGVDLIPKAIKRVLDGHVYLSETMQTALMDRYYRLGSKDAPSPEDKLSDRELEVFSLIGRGRKTRDLAESLGLSVKTIETHRERIKEKLALDDGMQLVHTAIEWVKQNDPDVL